MYLGAYADIYSTKHASRTKEAKNWLETASIIQENRKKQVFVKKKNSHILV